MKKYVSQEKALQRVCENAFRVSEREHHERVNQKAINASRGGSRPGAGRPKSDVKRVNLTVSLPVENKARIDARAKLDAISASELVKRWSDGL